MKDKTLRQIAKLFSDYGYEEAMREQENRFVLDREVRAAFVKGRMVEAQHNDDVKRLLDLQGGKE